MFHSYYPQAHLTPHSRAADQSASEGDWLHLDEDEFALVRPLSLARESYLPLQIYEDRMLEQSGMDPMAGLIGLLSSGSRTVGGAEGGDRLGMRLLLKPAPADWGAKHQAPSIRRRCSGGGTGRTGRRVRVPRKRRGPAWARFWDWEPWAGWPWPTGGFGSRI